MLAPPDPPAPPDLIPPGFVAALASALPAAVERISYWVGDWTVVVPAAELLAAARHLRDGEAGRFDFCSDVTAVDWPDRPERFDIVYSLYSTVLKHRLRLKVRTAAEVPTVSSIWPAANWL